jgi:hypothetical protein
MLTNRTRAAVLALAIMTPVALHAQRGMGGGGRGGVGGGANPVAPLIDMRRELNLSARQLVQLDSIERTLLQRNETLRGRLRTRMDSLRPRNRQSSEEEIARFRAEGDSLRALRQVMVRNDSVARAGAMAVLNDSQRVRVRERMAFDAGRRSAVRGGQGGVRGGRQGMQGGGRGMRPGGMRGGRGMVGPGMRGRDGMRGPDGFAPRRFDDGRTMPDEMRRFRRPPGDDVAPGESGIAPRRRFMDDSTRMERAPRLRRPPADSGR